MVLYTIALPLRYQYGGELLCFKLLLGDPAFPLSYHGQIFGVTKEPWGGFEPPI